jgi:hypothetical protein
MFFPMARSLRAGLTLLCAAGIILATGGSLSAQVVVDDIADPAAAKKGEAKKGEASGIPEIGEVPDGTPEELLAFIDKLQKTNFKPTSRQQAEAFLGKVAKTSVTVADKILDQTGPKDEARARAARMKLQSLTLLARLGDRDAEATLGDFAESLVSGGDAELAAEAAQIVLEGRPGAARDLEEPHHPQPGDPREIGGTRHPGAGGLVALLLLCGGRRPTRRRLRRRRDGAAPVTPSSVHQAGGCR